MPEDVVRQTAALTGLMPEQVQTARRGQPDAAIFAVAQAEGRAIVTENVADERPLAAEAAPTPG